MVVGRWFTAYLLFCLSWFCALALVALWVVVRAPSFDYVIVLTNVYGEGRVEQVLVLLSLPGIVYLAYLLLVLLRERWVARS